MLDYNQDIPEIVLEGKTGILFDPFDFEDFKQSIKKIEILDYFELSKNAIEYSSNFEEDYVHTKYLKPYLTKLCAEY